MKIQYKVLILILLIAITGLFVSAGINLGDSSDCSNGQILMTANREWVCVNNTPTVTAVYCENNSNCTLNNLKVFNLTVTNFANFTVTNYQVTGDVNATGTFNGKWNGSSGYMTIDDQRYNYSKKLENVAMRNESNIFQNDQQIENGSFVMGRNTDLCGVDTVHIDNETGAILIDKWSSCFPTISYILDLAPYGKHSTKGINVLTEYDSTDDGSFGGTSAMSSFEQSITGMSPIISGYGIQQWGGMNIKLQAIDRHGNGGADQEFVGINMESSCVEFFNYNFTADKTVSQVGLTIDTPSTFYCFGGYCLINSTWNKVGIVVQKINPVPTSGTFQGLSAVFNDGIGLPEDDGIYFGSSYSFPNLVKGQTKIIYNSTRGTIDFLKGNVKTLSIGNRTINATGVLRVDGGIDINETTPARPQIRLFNSLEGDYFNASIELDKYGTLSILNPSYNSFNIGTGLSLVDNNLNMNGADSSVTADYLISNYDIIAGRNVSLY